MTGRNEGGERGDRARGDRARGRRGAAGPFGTLFGATFGPVGAAVGSAVDANRLAVTFSFGTGIPGGARRSEDDGLEDAATIEIEDTGAGGDSASTGDGGEDGA